MIYSPSGLARSLSTGLRDFVSMPVQGLLRGPWGFIVGITHGSASLLRNITAGTVNSVTKFLASVSRNLDRLTLDEEHLERTEALRRLRPQGITHGFAQGLTGFGMNLLGAVGGIARHTLEARSSVGVVTGFGKGLVGVVAKPISGAAELVALTGQGMLHTVGFNTMPIARKSLISRNFSLGPCPEKITWKIFSLINEIIFSTLAIFINTKKNNELNNVIIILTFKFFVIISIECDEVIELVDVDKIKATIDEGDNTLMNLNILLIKDINDKDSERVN